MQSPYSVDSSQINLLKNLDDIDDIFNGLAHEDDAQVDQDFEDFLECFSEENEEEEDSQDDSNFRGFPSFRNVSPSFNLSTFADSNMTVKKSEERLLQASGDQQFPYYDEEEQQQFDDSVEENQEDDLSDFFDSFDIDHQDQQQQEKDPNNKNNNSNNNNNDDLNYIEIKYFDETYKIPIFTAKLFEQEQTLEDKLIFENAELVMGEKIMDMFQNHMEKLQFQKGSEDFSFSAMILKIQSVLLADVCNQFQQMKDFQQKWLQASPSNTCQIRVTQFSLQFKQFQDSVNYVIDSNSNKMTSRRYFDKIKPAYFQDSKQEKPQKEMTEEEKILELQQIPYNQHSNPQSNLVSILYFKGIDLFEAFLQFLHYKRSSDKYKEVITKYRKLKDIFTLVRLFKSKIVFYQKYKGNNPKYQVELSEDNYNHHKINSKYNIDISGTDKYQKQNNQVQVDLSTQEQLSQDVFQFYRHFRSMKMSGIVKALEGQQTACLARKIYQFKNPTKYMSQKFLQFDQQVY